MAGSYPGIGQNHVLTAASDVSWINTTVYLKFAFAGVLLYKMTFPASELDLPFFRMSTDPCDPPLPAGAWEEHREAARIRSHPVDGKLRRVLLLPEAVRYVPSQYRRYFVDLEGSFDGYMAGLSRHFRLNLRRKVRRLAELSGGGISWSVYRTPLEMREFHALARDVSGRSWQERVLGSGFDGGAEFRENLLRLAASDKARGYILFHEGVAVAYACC